MCYFQGSKEHRPPWGPQICMSGFLYACFLLRNLQKIVAVSQGGSNVLIRNCLFGIHSAASDIKQELIFCGIYVVIIFFKGLPVILRITIFITPDMSDKCLVLR